MRAAVGDMMDGRDAGETHTAFRPPRQIRRRKALAAQTPGKVAVSKTIGSRGNEIAKHVAAGLSHGLDRQLPITQGIYS
jgi:hypothetical protein